MKLGRRTFLQLAGGLTASLFTSAQAAADEMRQFDLTHAADQTSHRLFTRSFGEPGPTGYRLLFLLDGNGTFEPAVAAAQSAEVPIVIAALGYPETDRDTIVARRYFDLTSAAPDGSFPRADDRPAPRTGGRDAFLAFILQTVLPQLESEYKIDRSRMDLYGHSLSGAFCLHALFSRQTPFSTYIAADPSIWWNNRELWGEAEAFLASGDTPETAVYIMSSGKRIPRPGQSALDQKRTNELRSGPGGREMADLLAQDPHMQVYFRHFPDETHGSLRPLTATMAAEISTGTFRQGQ